MPIRTPILWSEALLNAVPRQSQESQPKAATEEPLVPRSMSDSYSELVLPFGSSGELMELYTNATGGVRTGKQVSPLLPSSPHAALTIDYRLMEHLDSLAGSIAYKHMLGPTVETLGRIQERGFYLVTASVDRCLTTFCYCGSPYFSLNLFLDLTCWLPWIHPATSE